MNDLEGKFLNEAENGTVPDILNMFYLSQKGMPLSVPHPEIEGKQTFSHWYRSLLVSRRQRRFRR